MGRFKYKRQSTLDKLGTLYSGICLVQKHEKYVGEKRKIHEVLTLSSVKQEEVIKGIKLA